MSIIHIHKNAESIHVKLLNFQGERIPPPLSLKGEDFVNSKFAT